MDISPAARDRLITLMNARRLELMLNWRDVATRAEVSYEAVRALRRGSGGLSELTARKLDRALEWQGGSIAAVIEEAGAPAEIPAPQPGAIPSVPQGLPPAIAGNWADPDVRSLWDLDVTADQRLALIEELLRIKESNGEPGSGSPSVS